MPLEFLWLRSHEIVSTSGEEEAFRVRRRYPETLAESITTRGVQTPLLVAKTTDGFRLVSGWGRWSLSGDGTELPCFVLPSGGSAEALWDRFLRDNDRWNVMEVGRVLRQLSALPDLSVDRIVREKLPLLGLRPAKDLYDGHLRLLQLPPEAQGFIETHGLPLRRARVLFKLPPAALPPFFELASEMRFTLNEIAEVLELVYEIAQRDEVDASSVIRTAAQSEPRRKVAVIQRLREQRFPQLSRYREQLRATVAAMRFSIPVRIEWDERLERPGVRLIADLADGDALDAFQRELKSYSEQFERLFDVL